jgi:hypothetical protein
VSGVLRGTRLPGLTLVLAVVSLLVGIRILDRDRAGAAAPPLPRADVRVSLGGVEPVAPVARGFVGLSIEFQAFGEYTGAGPNPVFEQLVRNLAPASRPVLRIGGESADHSWWPARGVRVGPGLTYALGPAWAEGVRTLARDLNARLILGINLEADSRRLARIESRRLLDGIGRRYVTSLELGNEPNLYGVLPWWKRPSGAWVRGRPPTYGPAAYAKDLARISAVLPRVSLAGPALGNLDWMQALPAYLRAAPGLRQITFHRYPLNRCFTHPGEITYPTLANLLSPVASRGLAASIGPFARFARLHRVAFRVDEMNSVACSGKQGISDTYASALWVADALFAMAAEGVTGVNLHTFTGARYRLFGLARSSGQWAATVAPEYYGALLFVRAAPPGSRLLHVSLRGASGSVRAWATLGGHPRAIRVLLINDSPSRSHVVQLQAPGLQSGGSLQRLTAPNLSATAGVTLAGQSFVPGTTSGRLTGAIRVQAPLLTGSGSRVSLPAASAALLTVPASRG